MRNFPGLIENALRVFSEHATARNRVSKHFSGAEQKYHQLKKQVTSFSKTFARNLNCQKKSFRSILQIENKHRQFIIEAALQSFHLHTFDRHFAVYHLVPSEE